MLYSKKSLTCFYHPYFLNSSKIAIVSYCILCIPPWILSALRCLPPLLTFETPGGHRWDSSGLISAQKHPTPPSGGRISIQLRIRPQYRLIFILSNGNCFMSEACVHQSSLVFSVVTGSFNFHILWIKEKQTC